MRNWIFIALISVTVLPVLADEATKPTADAVTPVQADEKAADKTTALPTVPVAPTAPAASAPAPSAEQVIAELLQQRQDAPAVDPVRTAVTPPPTGNITDRRVLGTAPDTRNSSPGLRREGDFVLSRRGRVVVSEAGEAPLFVFAADGVNAAEPPMKLAPSQLTEQVERIVKQRSDRVVFVITGQVLTYRGANHLLPTQIMEDFDQGNLKP